MIMKSAISTWWKTLVLYTLLPSTVHKRNIDGQYFYPRYGKNESAKLRTKYNDIYDNYVFKMLYVKRDSDNSKGKYEIYCQVKRQYRMKKYLLYLNDKQMRKNITGVRCASNILPINHF